MELFQTTGHVEFAEVVHEGGRSKGVGVVQFSSVEDAEIAIQKFRTFVLYSGMRGPGPTCFFLQRAISTVGGL